jgi:hypothetical protein
MRSVSAAKEETKAPDRLGDGRRLKERNEEPVLRRLIRVKEMVEMLRTPDECSIC